MTRASMRGVVVYAGLLAVTQGIGRAGDLNPPAGPASSTAKPLSEIEPRTAISAENTPGDADSVFRITAPGSYYLTGNLVVPSNRRFGIEVAASDVTIDLEGFTIDAAASSFTLAACVGAVNTFARVTVRNGAVVNSNDDGIEMGVVTEALIEGISAVANEGVGIAVGDNSIVRGCAMSANTQGLSVTGHGIVDRCTLINNGGHGVVIQEGRVTGCTAIGNGFVNAAIFGGITLTGAGGLLDGNYVAGNKIGIIAGGSGWTIVRNVAKGNVNSNYNISGVHHVGVQVADPALAGPFDNIGN